MSLVAWPLLLMVSGLFLLIAEVFLPSGGVVGILALSCLVLSLWRAFERSTELGLIFLLAELILLPIFIALAFYLWPKTWIAKKVFLKLPSEEEIGESRSGPRLDHLVGQFGRALTPLRPSGMVDLDGRRLDGLAEVGLIPSGTLVQVVRVRSGQLIVRVAPEPTLEKILT